ncbi:MAG: DeoR/GlpR family DNA-binding transcription regulator [Chthoniobacterales bacterium]
MHQTVLWRPIVHDTAAPDLELFPIERRERILEALTNHGKVIAADLATSLRVSVDTVRRDLNQLVAEGLARRVHGGALRAAPFPRKVTECSAQPSSLKPELAQKAVALIQSRNVVLFDGGSTNQELIRSIPRELPFTAVTPSLPVATALSELPLVEVIVLGGRILARELVTTGVRAVKEISDFRADLCYLGVCAVHRHVGVSTFSVEELELKQALIRCAGTVAAVISAEKFGKMAPFVVGPARILSNAFVEAGADPKEIEQLRIDGVCVV